MTAIIKSSAIYRFVIMLYKSYLNSSLLKISTLYEKSLTKCAIVRFIKILKHSIFYRLLYPFVDISSGLSGKSFFYRMFTYPFILIIKLLQIWPGRLVERAINNSSFLNTLSRNKKSLRLNVIFYVGLGIFVYFGVFTSLYYTLNKGLDKSLYMYAGSTLMGLFLILASTTNIRNGIKTSLIYRITYNFFQVFWKE